MSGFGLNAGVNGLLQGAEFGLGIQRQKKQDARQASLDEERRTNRADDVAYRDRAFNQNQQTLDLNHELTGLKINAEKNKTLMEQGQFVSKRIRAAMTDAAGNRLSQDAFRQLPEAEQTQRMDIIHRGANWLTNDGGFMKGYFGSNPSVNSDKPVSGFQLMQSNTGDLGVLTHLNRKDGKRGGLDYPNRKDGEATIIPAEVFTDLIWNATGVFDDGKLTDRQKLGAQHTNSMAEIDKRNKNAVDLENLKNSHKDPKDTRTPMRKNMEYLIESGLAKTPAEALQIVQRAKSDPTKLMSEMVQKSKENQLMFNIKADDPRYRTGEQMVTESRGLIDQINGKVGQGHQVQPPQQESLPQQAASALKEGHVTTFGNGQSWTIQDGRTVRVK